MCCTFFHLIYPSDLELNCEHQKVLVQHSSILKSQSLCQKLFPSMRGVFVDPPCFCSSTLDLIILFHSSRLKIYLAAHLPVVIHWINIFVIFNHMFISCGVECLLVGIHHSLDKRVHWYVIYTYLEWCNALTVIYIFYAVTTSGNNNNCLSD